MEKKFQIKNEIWSAITHGIGVALSIWILVLLILKGVRGSGIELTAYLIYGISLVLLYLFSTLFHCLYFTRASRVFQIFDHCGIFILIAGTYTPYCLLAIKGIKGIILLSIIWFLALFGIAYHVLAKNRLQIVETMTFIGMGWACVFYMKDLIQALGKGGTLLLFAGGVAFTLGAVIYSFRTRYGHVYWHVIVMIGTALMFLSIYLFI